MDALKRLLRIFLSLFIRKKNETGTGPMTQDKENDDIQEFRVLSCDVVSIVEIEETN